MTICGIGYFPPPPAPLHHGYLQTLVKRLILWHKRFIMALDCFRAVPLRSSVVCDSEWVTVAFTQRVLNTHRIAYNTFELFHGWCHVTAALSAHVLRTPYNHAPVYSDNIFEATYAGWMCA